MSEVRRPLRARLAWIRRLWRAEPLENGGRWRAATVAFGILGPAACFAAARALLRVDGDLLTTAVLLWVALQAALLLAWLALGRGSRPRAAFLAGALWSGTLASLAASIVCVPLGAVFVAGGLWDLQPEPILFAFFSVLPPLCLGAWGANALLATAFAIRQRSGRVALPFLAGFLASSVLTAPPITALRIAQVHTEAAVLALDADDAAGPVARMRPFAWACDWSELAVAWGRETDWGRLPDTPRAARIRAAYEELTGDLIEEDADRVSD